MIHELYSKGFWAALLLGALFVGLPAPEAAMVNEDKVIAIANGAEIRRD